MTTDTTLTRNAVEILHSRPYLQPNETIDEMWHRIAVCIAGTEQSKDHVKWRDSYIDLMSSLRFMPNTPTVAFAGVDGDHCLSACFVVSPEDSLKSIIEVATQTPLIEGSGGGIGWGLGQLRPKGDVIGDVPSGACGPVRVLKWYSKGGDTFTQGAIRMGAHMAQLPVSHPDIIEFITCKSDCYIPTDELSNVNISVQLTDEFMEAVRADWGWLLVNPRNGDKTDDLDAREIWDVICTQAHKMGDPGVVFIDRVIEAQPHANLGPILSSNPCGEEFLENGGSCNLGSINLSKYVLDRGSSSTDFYVVDWDGLVKDIPVMVRFLDSVIDANWFPFKFLQDMNLKTRRIGLGVMGWADMLVLLGLKYDSDEAVDLAKELSSFITLTATNASIKLGDEKGTFVNSPNGAPRVSRQRNSSVTTIAPTGSISIIAGCSSGIEPYFDLMWERKSLWSVDGTFGTTLIECPAPLRAAINAKGFVADDFLRRAFEDPIDTRLEDHDLSLYRTAHDISPEWHVKMQAAWQSSVTNGVSKTINLDNKATIADVSDAFMLAWELKCKAVTVYRDGSKEQVLTGHVVDKQIDRQKLSYSGKLPKRPASVRGQTIEVKTGHGNWFFTINEYPDVGGDGIPKVQEVFLIPQESNACVRAGAEVVGVLISIALRSGVDLSTIQEHLKGIDCGHGIWVDGELITSVYDGLARVLVDEPEPEPAGVSLDEFSPLGNAVLANNESVSFKYTRYPCPKCSQIAMVHSGGCLRCVACGHNNCE